MQPEIYHQNSQYFYPSERFRKKHITMRHPVEVMVSISLALECKNEAIIFHKVQPFCNAFAFRAFRVFIYHHLELGASIEICLRYILVSKKKTGTIGLIQNTFRWRSYHCQMALQSAGPNQPSFGNPGQTKVSGDCQRRQHMKFVF